MRRAITFMFVVASLGVSAPRAQMRVTPLDDVQGHVALGLALRHLSNAGIFMMATAHPDDENNALLVMLNRGQGYRTALATATRGNGGQNEIGPEIFEALGVLRTEELAALHRFDGAEQYFTRAVDFGFSFSVEETFEKWGRDEILGDFVRLIRMVRPDVIAGLSPDGAGGGQHHQASAVLAREAFAMAGDPTKFPEQLRDGLRAWSPKKFYFTAGFGSRDAPAGAPQRPLSISLSTYDALLGKTYAEIGTEARSMHKCQGMAQLLSLPGPATSTYYLVDSTVEGQAGRDDRSMFDGVDTSVAGLARYAGAAPPRALVDGLAAIGAAAGRALRAFESQGDAAVLQPVADGLSAVRALRAQLPSLSLEESARFEIDFRLAQKEREFADALVLAASVRIETLADDGIVVPGQPVRVSVMVANRGAGDVTVRQVAFDGFAAGAACSMTAVTSSGVFGGGPGAAAPGEPMSTIGRDRVAQCNPSLSVPADARPSEPYWHRAGDAGRYTFDADAPFGLPYRPTPFRVRVMLTLAGEGRPIEVEQSMAVVHRYEGNIFSGEKRSELLVVPRASVRVAPSVAIIPSGGAQTSARPTSVPAGATDGREVRVTVVNGAKTAGASSVHLELPAGWTADPPEQAVRFAREDESQTVRFQVHPPPGAAAGEYHVRAAVTSDGAVFRRGYQVIEYPHIRRQHIFYDADVTLKVIDVKVAPNLRIGYVMGVGDEVPPALEQLGVPVRMLDGDDLAWGNLSQFTTIITGVRAYERRADLRANNSRLLAYVQGGGTLIVQYNKFEFNEAQYGPYPARVSSERVTDEYAPVTLLDAASPVFTTPNRIGGAAWSGWVQERGLYFLGERDPQYRDLLSLEEPFPYNKGVKRGALVEASYGKGRWIYLGLGLWRELPAGVDGAYLLLANLVSLGSASR